MTDEVSSDHYLIRKVADGDVRAFRELVDRHMPRGHAIAYRVLLNQEDTEEAVQTAFTKIWSHAKHFDSSKSAFQTWFYTIVTRTCLDMLRRKKPRAEPIYNWSDCLTDAAPDALSAIAMKQKAAAVRTAVSGLPDRQRMAVVLSYFEEFSNSQCALYLNLSLKAYEALLFRARQSLKNSIGFQDG